MKPPPWATVPVCNECHADCHDGHISFIKQTQAMVNTWIEIGIKRFGAEKFWKKLGEEFWRILDE